MQAQIAQTLAWLDALDPAAFGDDADRPVEFSLPNGMVFDLRALDYVRDWALPQFYFHIVAAYAILRHMGVPLGKAVYASYMMQPLRPGTAPAACSIPTVHPPPAPRIPSTEPLRLPPPLPPPPA